MLGSAVEFSHSVVSRYVQEGDTVIDATAGKGKDTAFLAQLVGEQGLVYAFDIQEQAIELSKQYLDKLNLSSRVELIKDSHHLMQEYISKEVSAVMFNLGYLPGTKSEIITSPETTVRAMQTGTELLGSGGVITLVIYTGHRGGKKEKNAVLDWCEQLDESKFTTYHFNPINQSNDPPSCVIIGRR